MLSKQSVAEGNDVFFVCKIVSNPAIDRMVEWFHNGRPLKQNQRKGIIMNSSGTNLVLQKVEKEARGNYTCRATNGVPGVGHYEQSEPFHLDVKYLPVCVPEGVKVYGVAKEENVRIRCQVAANPSNLTFRWTFNNSAEIKDVDRRKFNVVNNSVSVFSYKPERELDYGTLMCWSRNSIGKHVKEKVRLLVLSHFYIFKYIVKMTAKFRISLTPLTPGEQQRPCVFHIIAAGRPDPVKNCSTHNVNNSAFQIHCAPGFNGGLPQNFTVEVIENETLDNVVFKGMNTEPVFSVTKLKDSTDYRVYVIPVNMKGSGQPQSPQGTFVRTLTAPQPIMAENPENFRTEKKNDNINPIMVIIFGGASGLVLIVVTITLAVRVRCSRRHSLAREDSKVVVTTIADLEFHDDHLSDRVALRSSKSGLTSSCSPENGKDISEFEGSPPSGYGSGESARILPHELRQVAGGLEPGPGPGQQLGAAGSLFSDQQPYLMLQPPPPAPAPHTFYTLRKHPAPSAAGAPQPPHRFSQAAADVEHKLDSIAATSGGGRQQPGSCESAEEFVAAYREKQRAGFMYGTLRHAPPRHTCGGPAPAPAVVPPPPMFEEQGAANPKTPLIATKKGEKKDKMESRV